MKGAWLLLILAFFICSCKKNPPSQDVETQQPAPGGTTDNLYITLSYDVLNLDATAGSFTLAIFSNTNWTVKLISPWLTASKLSGKGNDSLKFTYSANSGTLARAGTVQITAANINKTLAINQSITTIPLQLTGFEALVGNGAAGISDSVYLHFNKHISAIAINSNYNFCVGDIGHYFVDNGTGVKFSYSCGAIGGSYPFTISATDDQGKSISQNISVNFYKAKLAVQGRITDYVIINNETEAVIATYAPDQLIIYSLINQKVIQTFDLSAFITPLQLSFNAYTSKIYMVGTGPNAANVDNYVTRPDIYSLDLTSGQINKEITIQPDPGDSPSYPYVLPLKLGFTSSGLGLVILQSFGSSGMRPEFINCNNGCKITPYPEFSLNYYFDNIQANYNNTKLFMTQTYTGSTQYGVFDGQTNTITMFQPKQSTTRSIFITPNKKNDQIYFGELYTQFIADLEGNASAISGIDNRSNATADFSYHLAEKNVIYFCDDSYIQILNYNNSTTLMYNKLINGIRKFNTMPAGDIATAFANNSDLTSSFFIFDVNSFYNHIIK